ncbi:hypothetical protein [Yinghuangia soli]|uniref:Uncharacterized protein n=1 Tax=Yinghuangia soli TaxID=2908204 RepID=A0AA41Q1B1_9ACTN|nr:hypothetical protein [Yinghuangia soli]MCF2529372.1 hypothetical protein [Yinghuangia soli]
MSRTMVQIMTDMREFLAPATDRPVVVDPRNLVPPCVLVPPPNMQPSGGTMCAPRTAVHRLLVLGLPGAWAEFGPLSELLDDILGRLEDGPGWVSADLIAYEPFVDPASGEPSMAYEIRVEEYA